MACLDQVGRQRGAAQNEVRDDAAAPFASGGVADEDVSGFGDRRLGEGGCGAARLPFSGVSTPRSRTEREASSGGRSALASTLTVSPSTTRTTGQE